MTNIFLTKIKIQKKKKINTEQNPRTKLQSNNLACKGYKISVKDSVIKYAAKA